MRRATATSGSSSQSDEEEEYLTTIAPTPTPSTKSKGRGKAQGGRRPQRRQATHEEEEDEDDEPVDRHEDGADSNLIVQTAFDAFFLHNSQRTQTSSNIFSSIIPPLSIEEHTDAIDKYKASLSSPNPPGPKPIQPSLLTEPSISKLFSRFVLELEEGFNILCYGFGSKRRVLNDFATRFCSKRGYVVVINGFQADLGIKEVLTAIENVPGIKDLELGVNNVEGQAKRIYEFFSRNSDDTGNRRKPHLYLVIHNIDAPPLRHPKARACLGLLALHPSIHIIASIDHLNAPLLWPTSETNARKHQSFSPSTQLSTSSASRQSQKSADETRIPLSRGFSWLWHDLTTLEPYDFELTYADHTSISGAHGGAYSRRKGDLGGLTQLGAGGAGAGGMISETAALHILASVTQKAKLLFVLMAKRQLESLEAAVLALGGEEGGGTSAAALATARAVALNDMQQYAIGYDVLFSLARDNFIATSDTALRALLGEFRDHGLVLGAQGSSAGSAEVLWIPMRKERLLSVLKVIDVPQ
ncbi:hypothetical protein AX16_004660 [Volvariella volvacea WC 439]|nr:hypothetical protein AX16_004660 [Volvariella volvacea WC 439]